MSDRNTRIIIAKGINISKDYSHVLALTAGELINLMNSQDHMLYSSTDYSFIRAEKRIKVQTNFNTIQNANFLALSNREFNGWKTYFYFIDEVIYISDTVTEILVTEDVFDTYKPETFNMAFCERQHSSSDRIYENTIAENISPSNYVKNTEIAFDCNPTRFIALFSEAYNYRTDNFEPVPNEEVKVDWQNKHQINVLHVSGSDLSARHLQGFKDYYFDYIKKGKGGDLVSLYTTPDTNDIVIDLPIPDNLDGYVPLNKKLFNYPFSVIYMSNNAGSTLNLKPELLDVTTFKCVKAHNGKAQSFCFPVKYMKKDDNYDYGLLIENYPSIPIPVDSYTEWLAQSQNGLAQGIVSSAIQAGLGFALAPVTGGLSALMGGVSAVSTLAGQVGAMAVKADNTPDTVKGRASGSIINQALQSFKFIVQHQSVNGEQARCIDDFFTRFGYAQQEVMPVRQTNARFNHHYVKTRGGECVVSGIPHAKAEIINTAFASGITFWKDNDTVGVYPTGTQTT